MITQGAVDMHVHIVGTGAGGTGCWLRVKGWHWPLAAFMTRHIGLSRKAFSGDFDRLYVERLALHNVTGGYNSSPPCPPGRVPCFLPYNPPTRGESAHLLSNSAGWTDVTCAVKVLVR